MSTRRGRVLIQASLLSVGLCGLAADAGATDPPATGSGSSCVIQGNAIAPKDQAIYSAATGGNRIAVFSGAITPLRATNFPADSNNGRMQINTAAGFRIEGFTDARSINVWSSRDIPVAPDHVWISGGRQLRVLGASPGRLRVELPARGSIGQPVQANASCDALSFGRTTPPVFDTPGNARGYVAQRNELDLHGSSAGDLSYTLHASGDGSSILLWSTETRGAYVHVLSRFELYVDAWVKRSDVKALPQGEMMDQAIPAESVQNPPSLALSNYLRIVQATHAIPIRFGRGDAAPVIGEIESGSEVYVLDIILSWASVIPKALHVMPTDEKGFWVKASDLGIAIPVPDGGVPRK
ncbi:MAG: hypothetical protein HY898_05225 [Deltaproteobacteria bacterium]|nr:hypothetical protein [Deltaproteobacteria bacterium]